MKSRDTTRPAKLWQNPVNVIVTEETVSAAATVSTNLTMSEAISERR